MAQFKPHIATENIKQLVFTYVYSLIRSHRAGVTDPCKHSAAATPELSILCVPLKASRTCKKSRNPDQLLENFMCTQEN